MVKKILIGVVVFYAIVWACYFAFPRFGGSIDKSHADRRALDSIAAANTLELIKFDDRGGYYFHAKNFNGSHQHYQQLRQHAQTYKGKDEPRTVLYFEQPITRSGDGYFGGRENQEKCIALYVTLVDMFSVNPNAAMKDGKEKFIEK